MRSEVLGLFGNVVAGWIVVALMAGSVVVMTRFEGLSLPQAIGDTLFGVTAIFACLVVLLALFLSVVLASGKLKRSANTSD